MNLRKTITELYEEKAKLDRVIASLEQLMENHAVTAAAPEHRRGRRFMSPQERRMVSERMRNYWAKRNGQQAEPAPMVMTSASAA